MRWVKKTGKSVFGYKQQTLVDDNGLMIAVETKATNRHHSQPLVSLIDKAKIAAGSRLHADKAYYSRKHDQALKERRTINGIQDKAVNNKPLNKWKKQRNGLITQARYVVERTFGSQARWLGTKIPR